MILLAACGDTGIPDDAPPAVGEVTVTVTFVSAPAVGSTVYFVDPDGTAQTVLTDANGVASATITAGASVTVIDPHEDFKARLAGSLTTFNGQVYTVLAVAPGDALTIDTFPTTGPDQFDVDVTVPPLSGATSFSLTPSDCGGVTPPLGTSTVQIPGCFGATHDLLLVGFDDSFTPVGSLLLQDQTLSEGGAITFTAPYDPPSTTTAAVTHLPVDGDAGVSKALATARGPLFVSSSGGAITGGSLSVSFPTIANAGNDAFTQIVETDYPQGSLDEGRILQWGPASDGYTLDAGPLVLPSFATVPTVDAQTQRVLWTEASGGGTATPDGIAMTFFIERPSAGSNWRWFVIAPGTQDGAVQLPTLPTDLFELDPAADDSTFFNQFETATITGGYRAFVAAHPWDDIDIGPGVLAIPGTSGTFSVTSLAL